MPGSLPLSAWQTMSSGSSDEQNRATPTRRLIAKDAEDWPWITAANGLSEEFLIETDRPPPQFHAKAAPNEITHLAFA